MFRVKQTRLEVSMCTVSKQAWVDDHVDSYHKPVI